MSGGRIRTIKPELLDDERTAALGHEEWRLFVSLILIADDYGNFRAHPKQLEGSIFWAADTSRGIRDILASVSRTGLVTLYSVRGQQYGHLTGWSKHQKVDKPGQPRVPGPEQADTEGDDLANPAGLARVGQIRESLATLSEQSREFLAPDQYPDQYPDPDQYQRPPTETKSAAPGVGRGSTGKKTGRPKPRGDVLAIHKHFLEVKRKHKPKSHDVPIDPKDEAELRKRLQSGYTVEQLKQACDGLFLSPHHLGQNDRNTEYLALKYALRNPETFIELASQAANVVPIQRDADPEDLRPPLPPPDGFEEQFALLAGDQ